MGRDLSKTLIVADSSIKDLPSVASRRRPITLLDDIVSVLVSVAARAEPYDVSTGAECCEGDRNPARRRCVRMRVCIHVEGIALHDRCNTHQKAKVSGNHCESGA